MTKREALEALELLRPVAYGRWPDKVESAYLKLRKLLCSEFMLDWYDPCPKCKGIGDE